MAGRFFGWRVVAASFGLAMFAYGTGIYGVGVWLHAIVDQRGWSPAFVSAAITLHFLTSAAIVSHLPRLYGRFGESAVTRAGLLAWALGCAAWAIADAPWRLLAAALVTGAALSVTGGPAINALIAPWFDRRRPAALAMAYNGASVGGMVFVPLWAGLIGLLGFAQAALIVGVSGLVLLWPLAGRYFGRTPGDLGLFPDGAPGPPAPRPAPQPAGPLWRQPRFRSLSGAVGLGTCAQVGLFAHLFSVMVPTLGPRGASLALSAATVCAILSRTAVGWLLTPGMDRRRVAQANLAAQAGGSLALLLSDEGSAILIVVGCLLFGLGIGNLLSLPPLIVQAEWPPAQVIAVVAANAAVYQTFFAAASGLFGLARGALGDWAVAALALALQLAAALLVTRRG
ncbi:MFS transporter [Roseomonas eburnea]|uniref:MFS transporter n=1 Tax=Neoroseomonas eburnea TaxID=1346889 RepID=A0A9X9X9Y0_9PROT|nr:MFS transporter [Neoroseomonas eburnea]MBR0680516.1 MFS transporter [Neoroseomonas eburnea]